MELEQYLSHELSRSLSINRIETLPSTNQYLTKMLVRFLDSKILFPENQEPLLIVCEWVHTPLLAATN